MKKCYSQLHPWAFALTLGIIWAASLFIMALIADWANYGIAFVQGVGSVYIDYHPGIVGGIIGAFWGLLDAFIGGIIFAWIYNLLLGKKCCMHQPTETVL